MNSAPGIPTVAINAQDRKLEINWAEGETSAFHFVWLRHSGRCGHGMPNDTSVKIDLLPDDPRELVIEACSIEDQMLVIDWQNDARQTRHSLDVLRVSAYDEAARQQRKHQPRLWDRDAADDIPAFAFSELQAEPSLLELLLAVRDYGIAKLTGVPSGSITEAAAMFGPRHVNNYGDIFDVKTDAKLNLGSNTGQALPPHTDESYRHEAPGISLFHCLEAAPVGGESILVDGFKAAQALRDTDFDGFEILTRVPVFFRRYALPDEDMRSHARMLVTDIDGDIVGIRWTDRTLPPQDLPDEYIEPVYGAIRSL